MSVHAMQHYPEIKRLLGIPDDEPIFILRGQDYATSATIEFYSTQRNYATQEDHEFLENLRQTMAEFQRWQTANSTKMKRAD